VSFVAPAQLSSAFGELLATTLYRRASLVDLVRRRKDLSVFLFVWLYSFFAVLASDVCVRAYSVIGSIREGFAFALDDLAVLPLWCAACERVYRGCL
jgi:hypothetical protein